MADTRLSDNVRNACLLAAALAALPLLRLTPLWLAALLVATGVIAALTSRKRPWPMLLRLLLTIALSALVVIASDFRFGRDTACALLLAMLALKVAEVRSLRDARSLAGFALFATFAAFLQDQGPITLALALPALAFTLDAFAQLAEAQASSTDTPPLKSRLRSAGARLALALPLALAGFWLFPRMGTPIWGVPENAVSKTGISGRMSPGDWLDVLSDDSPAFRVRFAGAEPPRRQLYWRGPVLWNFDGRTWLPERRLRSADPAQLIAGDQRYQYELTMEPTEKRYLFALDWPLQTPENGRMAADLSPYANEPIRSLSRYTLSASSNALVEPELSRYHRQLALSLPQGFNPRTRALAAQWRREGATDSQMIERALAWINTDFNYDLAAPPLGRNSVDEFLYDTRTGFCEHFSSSFVFLLRAAGVPARVVTGYVGGYRNPIGEYWVIQQSDAHAWAEVWLPQRGWVRVDPTAAVDPARVFERYGRGSGIGSFGGALAPMLNVSDWLRRGWNDLVLSYDAARQQLVLRAMGIKPEQSWQGIVVFVVVALLMLAVTLLWLARQQSQPLPPVLRAWRRMVQRFERAGLAHTRHEPALHYGERAARRWPSIATQIRSLSQRFSNWRYAQATLTPDVIQTLARDLDRMRPPRHASSNSGEAP